MTSLKAKGKKERGHKPTHNEEEDMAEVVGLYNDNIKLLYLEEGETAGH
jgi:hypothetical protein